MHWVIWAHQLGSLTPNCDFASRKNGLKLFFSSSEERFHKNDVVLFSRSSPFVYLVMLACFIVKNRLLLFCAAVIPAEQGEWDLGCAVRTPSIALFPKCLSAAAHLPIYRVL